MEKRCVFEFCHTCVLLMVVFDLIRLVTFANVDLPLKKKFFSRNQIDGWLQNFLQDYALYDYNLGCVID